MEAPAWRRSNVEERDRRRREEISDLAAQTCAAPLGICNLESFRGSEQEIDLCKNGANLKQQETCSLALKRG
ncbi:hypothetical protein GOP47_0028951 [Adiantum capillus-veneris]|nr:hypothetical protein GOP47_0028951 [Adiantum capillus-veneris]